MSAPNKKPTMMQVKEAITNLIQDSQIMSHRLNMIDSVIGNYIKFNDNEQEFKEFLTKKLDEEKLKASEKKESK